MSARQMLRWWLRGLRPTRRTANGDDVSERAHLTGAPRRTWRPVRASWLLLGPAVEPDRSRHLLPAARTPADAVIWARHAYPDGWWHEDPWAAMTTAGLWLGLREDVRQRELI